MSDFPEGAVDVVRQYFSEPFDAQGGAAASLTTNDSTRDLTSGTIAEARVSFP
jgi:hypothetical protein